MFFKGLHIARLKLGNVLFAMLFMAMVIPVSGQVRFIENKGQWAGAALYRAELKGGKAYIENNQVRYNFIDGDALKKIHEHIYSKPYIYNQAVFLNYVGANSNAAAASAGQAFPEYYNFFLGNDHSQWASGINAYKGIYIKNLYSNIDLSIAGDGDGIKYTYYVGKNGDPSRIVLQFRGADSVRIKNDGLHIYTRLNEVIEQTPFAYAQNGSEKTPVLCDYQMDGDNVTFSFPQGYDPNLPLVIDPTVIFASFSGSTADNWGFTGTYDSLGDGYSGGTVYDVGFPTAYGLDSTPIEPNFQGGDTAIYKVEYNVSRDAGILKYSPHGDTLLFATYLGGHLGNEEPHSMVVDAQDNLIVFGTTSSTDFPLSANAFQKTLSGSYHKYVKNEYAGYSKTDSVYNGYSIFVTRIASDGRKILGSTYMGGSNLDGLNGYLPTTWFGDESHENVSPLGYNYGDIVRGEVISDKNSNIYVGTCTQSKNFLVTTGAAQTTWGGGSQDGCVFKLSPDCSKLLWSTLVGGGKWDAVFSIQLDSSGNIFATGGTNSTYFLNDATAYQQAYKGSVNGFVCEIASDGSKFLHGTYIGKASYNQSYFVQLDANQDVYLYGQTRDTTFPVVNANYNDPGTGQFIAKFDHNLDKLLVSTTFGHRASGRMIPNISPSAFLVDICGRIYISGWGGQVNDSLLFGQYKLGHGGQIYGMKVTSSAYETKTSKGNEGSGFYAAVFERDMDSIRYGSFFGGSDFSSEEHVDGGTSRFDKRGIMYQSVCGGCNGFSNFPIPSGIKVWSRTNNSSNCNNLLFKVDLGIPENQAHFTTRGFTCSGSAVTFTNTSTAANSYYWDFGDGTHSTAQYPTHVYDTVKPYLVTLITTNINSCILHDTFRENITVYDSTSARFTYQKQPCSFTVSFTTHDDTSATYSWNFGDGTVSHLISPVHTYKQDGIYTVKLTTDSGTRCKNTSTQVITIIHPKADFNYTICHNTVSFTGAPYNSDSFIWYFTPKDTSTVLNPIFTFKDSGSYDVKFFAISKVGNCIDSVIKPIKVPQSPAANFTWRADTCTHQIYFINKSTGSSVFNWSFGNGKSYAGANPPPVYYAADSTYSVSLTAGDPAKCPNTMTQQVKPIPRPRASFTYSKDTCNPLMQFYENSYRGYTFYWLFGDGKTDTGRTPQHKFTANGNYNVTLIINRSNDCIDSATMQVYYYNFPYDAVMIPNVFTPDGDGLNDAFTISGFDGKCTDYTIQIFNRWGQLLYDYTGIDVHWNGTTTDGTPLAAGTYFYLFKSTPTGEREGTITIVR